MADPLVTKCVECGGLVSSAAKTCPHCHKPPFMYYCDVCGGSMKYSESSQCEREESWRARMEAMGLPSFERGTRVTHSSCIQFILSQEFECPACQTHIAVGDTSVVHGGACPNCAHPIATAAICDRCGIWLPEGTGVMVYRQAQVCCVHQTCVPGARRQGFDTQQVSQMATSPEVLLKPPRKAWWQFWK